MVKRWGLPEGWEIARLGDLVWLKTGFACAKKNLVSQEEGLPHLRPFNIGTNGEVDLSRVYYIPRDFRDGIDQYALKPGHVLFNNTNSVELVGKTALVREPLQCGFSNHITRLTVKLPEHLDPAWLALALRYLWATGYFAERCNRWIGQAGINTKMLARVEIPLPSLPEQRRIVARIEALFAELTEARRLHGAIRQDIEAVMEAALGEVFPPSFEQLAKRWSIRELGKDGLCIIIPGQHILSSDYFETPIGVPYITGPADFGAKYPLISKWTQVPKVFCSPGDVLLTVKGAGVGKVNCAPSEAEVCIGRQIMAIRPDPSRIHTDFLYYFLRSRFEVFQAMGRSATVPGIRKDQVSQLAVPVPDLHEQRRIVAYLEEVQAHVTALKRAQEAAAAELERLEQAILARAFRGEL